MCTLVKVGTDTKIDFVSVTTCTLISKFCFCHFALTGHLQDTSASVNESAPLRYKDIKVLVRGVNDLLC